MPFHFCPQCGTKLQPGFKFCPSCGEKLPCPADVPEDVGATASLNVSPLKSDKATALIIKTSLASSTSCEATESSISPRPAIRKTRNTLRLDREATPPASNFTNLVRDDRIESDFNDLEAGNSIGVQTSALKQHTVTFNLDAQVEPKLESSPALRSVRGKANLSPRAVKQVEKRKRPSDKTSGKQEESTVDGSLVAVTVPVSSPNAKSPSKGKGKAKKAKHAPAVEPLQEGEEVTDTTGKKWKLVKLLSQSTTEVIYEVVQTVSRANSKGSDHILKLGAKDGRIFNEQNFLQRAAKPASVDKWIKQNKMDFLGIPSCVGFGPHAESYRFLIFPSIGQSLQSVMEDGNQLLSEKVVLQLTCRILDVMQYIHLNEYVHADISAENIYITPGQESQVYLVGYCYAFRYCPGGQHVEYREASRTAHEGTMEFISLDAHKGAAPSRRSDLQSLGYCMLCWHIGALPWSTLTEPEQVATQKERYMEDVPALLSHCFGKKKVSSAFKTYLTAVMALQYSEEPDYSALKAGLSSALQQLGGSPEEQLSF